MTGEWNGGMLSQVADRFRILAEATRLRILAALCDHPELTVSQLVELTGLGQANLSKHLQLLYSGGFVVRRREGLYVWYALADREAADFCDRMRARLEREREREHIAASGRLAR
jgi:DNA-binding transcriptional ArsR family regulator